MEAASGSRPPGPLAAPSLVDTSLAEHRGSAAFTLDADGNIIRWSAGAERLLGWPARQVRGRSMAFLVPPERAYEQERIMRQCARHGRRERLMTQRLSKDGARVDILLTLVPVQDSAGRLTAVLGEAHAATSPEARARELERIVPQLTAMTEVALAVGGETSTERVLDLIAERGRALMGGRGLVILRGLGSRVTVAAGGDSEVDLRGARLLCPAPLLDKLLAESYGPVHLRADDSGLILRGEAAQVAPTQALLVPMMFSEQSHGWVLAYERREDQAGFSDDDAQLLRAYGSMAAASLATARSGEDERVRQSIEASDSQRAFLARELHDQTLQGLGGMRVMLALAKQSGDPAQMAGALAQAVEDLGAEIAAVRRMTQDLRPPALDDLGLAGALDSLVERHRAGGRLRLEAAIHVGVPGAGEVDPETERTIYRLVQEALTNVVKHSGAARVRIRVRRVGEALAVEVTDDGCGFDAAARSGGFGLPGMRERSTAAGGTFRVVSSPGSGTTVHATIPLRHAAEPAEPSRSVNWD